MSGIGGHARPYKGATDVWLTPPAIIEALGPFDLDPCAALEQPWRTAAVQYTEIQNGLAQEWRGRVWLNPPYGPQAHRWIGKLADHGDGIALVFARTDTRGFQRSARRADAILFLHGRLVFHLPDGSLAKSNAGGPSCFLAFGERNVRALLDSGLDGFLVAPRAAIADPETLFGETA